MNNFLAVPISMLVFLSGRLGSFVDNERGGVTAEYGTVILVAIALALAVFALITGGGLDSLLRALLGGVLNKAAGLNAAA